MTWEEAVRNMIRNYFEGDGYENSQSFQGKKYNKKYFDNMKAQFLTPKEEKKKGKK